MEWLFGQENTEGALGGRSRPVRELVGDICEHELTVATEDSEAEQLIVDRQLPPEWLSKRTISRFRENNHEQQPQSGYRHKSIGRVALRSEPSAEHRVKR